MNNTPNALSIRKISNETSYIVDKISPRMTGPMVEKLQHDYSLSKRKRHRFCFHQNPDVNLHDIVICYDKSSYIRPNKHIGKSESVLVLQGDIEIYIFNDFGDLIDLISLGTFNSKKPCYVRIPPNTWHGLRSVSDIPVIMKETISGPYDSSSLIWADFAPPESETGSEGHAWYVNLESKARFYRDKKFISTEFIVNKSPGVFHTTSTIARFDQAILKTLLESAKSSPLKRSRYCCHNGSEEKLQEMFILLLKDTNIDESFHIRKDESLVVLDGLGSYFFPNEDGSERLNITLADFELAKSEDVFFARINRYVPHQIFVNSDYLLIYEATTGPFHKLDTDYRIKIVGEQE